MTAAEELSLDLAWTSAAFVGESELVHLLATDAAGVVTSCNAAFEASFQRPREEILGASLWPRLTTPDAELLRGLIGGDEGAPPERLLLNFLDRGEAPFTLSCRVRSGPDGLIVLGEHAEGAAPSLQAELLHINNELAVLAREHERARRELAEALEERDRSFWHLRKLQEVLPICMACDRVKTGEAHWESVVSYLRDNSLFLSHGMCPACWEKMDLK